MPHDQYKSLAANQPALLPTGASNTYKSKHFTIRYADQNEAGSSPNKEASLKKLAVEIVLHGPALLELLKGDGKTRNTDPYLPA